MEFYSFYYFILFYLFITCFRGYFTSKLFILLWTSIETIYYSILLIKKKTLLRSFKDEDFNNNLLKHFDGTYKPIKLSLFFLPALLDDDQFAIYAALKSGANTYMITNDFLTDHLQKFTESRRSVIVIAANFMLRTYDY